MSIPILRFKDENGVVHDVPAIRGYSAYQVAVQNGFEGTVTEWLVSLNGGGIDDEMSDESMNPVRNKVIKAYIDSLIGDVESAITYLRSIIGNVSVDPGNTDTAAALALIDDLDDIVGV